MIALMDDERLVRWRRGYAGAGLATLLALVAVTVAVGLDWMPLHEIDMAVAIHYAGVAAATPGWTGWWSAVGFVISPVGTYLVALAACGWLWRLRADQGAQAVIRQQALADIRFVISSVAGGGLITYGAKSLTDRARPDGAAIEAFHSSFPSGHASAAVVVAFVAAFVLRQRVRRVRSTVLIASALVLAVFTAYSRVALAVHYVTDVIAGLALGFAWCALCAWWCYRNQKNVRTSVA